MITHNEIGGRGEAQSQTVQGRRGEDSFVSSYWSTAFEPNMAVESIQLSSCSLLLQLLIASLFWILHPDLISSSEDILGGRRHRERRDKSNKKNRQQRTETTTKYHRPITNFLEAGYLYTSIYTSYLCTMGLRRHHCAKGTQKCSPSWRIGEALSFLTH